jgi:hypothetical protein
MKKLLLSLGVVFTTFAFYSQVNSYFYEDFTSPQAWGLTSLDADTNGWLIASVSSGALANQGAMAISESWQDDGSTSGIALTPDNFIISPRIDLSGATGTVALSFYVGSPETTASGYYAEYLSVYVFDGVNGITSALTNPIHSQLLEGGDQMYHFSYDISSFAGADSLFLAFRHHNCTDMNFIALDDISVTNSLSIKKIDSFITSVYPNPASEVLNIQLNTTATSVSILGLDGKVISTEKVNSTTVAVNVANLVSGMYLYEVTSANGEVVRNSFVKK